MAVEPRWEDGPGRWLVPLGGLAVVASAFASWVDRGAGSTVALHELGDLLLGGTVARVVPRWAGVVPYLIPAAGAVVVAAAGVHGRAARRVVVAAVVVLAVLVAVAIALPVARHVRPALGQAVAGAGVALASLGLVLSRGDRSPGGERPSATAQNDL